MGVKDYEPFGKDDPDLIDSPGGGIAHTVSYIIYYCTIWPVWSLAKFIAGVFFAETITAHLPLALAIAGIELLVIIALIKYWIF